MNERIDKIYEQVLDEACPNPLYRFAELVEDAARFDERLKCSGDYLADCAAAVEAARLEEREACALLLENKYTNGDNCECWLESMAEEIRGRTK